MRYLICGAGGFIGGHLSKRLLEDGHEVKCVDIKSIDTWFQVHDLSENYSLDLCVKENCIEMTKNVDFVINLACNMGGIGFIESHKAECMISVLINTHLLLACRENRVNNYFFSSTACVYNTNLQNKSFVKGLKETDAYPAFPEDGYGWEKLFSERMCHHFAEDFGLNTKVARFHNIYGDLGTFDGGREKSPAALCRKIAKAKLLNQESIEVWGNGEQTRSYLYIEDCIDAILKLCGSDFSGPVNIGSEEQVSINHMIQIIEKISGYKVNKKYDITKPIGVMGRSSDNQLILEKLNWKPSFTLEDGLSKTFLWIEEMIKKNKNTKTIFG